ncbi:MAG: acyl-CoA reductase, partial [Vulcanimicrobiaceae bacterium]
MTPLESLTTERILTALADACARWSNADFPPRVRCLDAIVQRTGYSLPVVEFALDSLFESVTYDTLHASIVAEINDIAMLDGFVADGPILRRGRPVGNVCILSSRTTIGVAIPPLLFALAAKCDVTIKDREDHLVAAFLETLAQEHPAFAQSARALVWHGDAKDLHDFDAVVAFGDDATLREIRAACSPTARFLGFGSRASAGYIPNDALRTEEELRFLAESAARDLLLYDTQGCMSLHLLFVERGGRYGAQQIAVALAQASESLAPEFPIGTPDPQDNARVTSLRALTALRSSLGTGALLTAPRADATFIVNPPPDEAPPFASRCLAIFDVDDAETVTDYLHDNGIALEALALAGADPTRHEQFAAMNVSRIASFGELQRPPLNEPHGGRPRILEYIHFCIV